MDIFSTPSSVFKAGFRQEQERDPKTGKWVKEAGAHLDSLKQRLRPGMSSKESASLKRDVKSHIKALNDQLKAARELHNKIGAKSKPWWQMGDKPSDRPAERIGGELGRKGYTDSTASKYLYEQMISEHYSMDSPRGLKFHDWIQGAMEEAPASVLLGMAVEAPSRAGKEQALSEARALGLELPRSMSLADIRDRIATQERDNRKFERYVGGKRV